MLSSFLTLEQHFLIKQSQLRVQTIMQEDPGGRLFPSENLKKTGKMDLRVHGVIIEPCR